MTARDSRWTFEILIGESVDDLPVTAAWSHDDRLLAVGCAGGEVVIYELGSKRERAHWQAHEHGLHRIAWHPQRDLLATSGQDGCVRLWSADDLARPMRQIEAPAAWVEHLAWSGDGRRLAFAAGRFVRVCSSEGDVELALPHPASTVAGIAWQRGAGQLALAGYGGVCILDCTARGRPPRTLALKGSVTGVRWSPDGRVIAASCQDTTVHFWRLADGSNARISGFDAKPSQFDWSPNSKWLATGGGATITLWRFDGGGPEGCEPALLAFHTDPVTAVEFAPSGPWLASGGRDAVLSVWRVGSTGQPVGTVRMSGRVESVAWGRRRSGLRVAAVSTDGQVGAWRLVGAKARETAIRRPMR